MDKINMMDYQRHVLKTKFGKSNQEKKTSKIYVITALILICVFFSLGFFSNAESQVLNSSSFFPGFHNIGEPLSWVKS
tara:strand:- start:128 stop:361 length:234 start_codon:yes stop_codon:yes gene_type:complete